MKELLLEQHLAQAEAQVVFGECLIAQQLQFLNRRIAGGLDTIHARRLLDQIEDLQLDNVSDRDWLLKKLAEHPCEIHG